MVSVRQPRALARVSSTPSQPMRASSGSTSSRHARRYARAAPQTLEPVTLRETHRSPSRS